MQAAVKRKPKPTGPQPSAYERIVRAAYVCFERFSIDRTSIEDIAREAGVSRPTIYKFFAGKDKIIDYVCAQESIKVNAEVRKRLIRRETFEDMMADALFLVIQIASQNPYVNRLLHDVHFHAAATTTDSTVHQMHKEWWGRLLETAAEKNELATDLSIDEVLTWITLTEHMLLVRIEGGPIDDDELRRLIRRFIVEPMLARGDRTKAKAVKRR